MDLLSIILILVVIGVVLYLVKAYLPIDPLIKNIITIVVVLFVCVWLLRLAGVGDMWIGPRR